MKFKDCDYFSGKTDDNKRYAYFGQVNKGTYDGLGLLYWNHPAFFLGQFENGDKKGHGLYRSNDGNMTFGLYEGWDNNGPTVAVAKGSSQIIFSVEKGKMKKFFFVIEPGEYLKKYSYDGKNSKLIKEIKKIKMPSGMPTFDMLTDFSKLGTGKFDEDDGKTNDGAKWHSFEEYVKAGKDHLDITEYSTGQTFLGVRNNGQLNGLNMAKLEKGSWIFGNYENGELCGIYFVVINDSHYGVAFEIRGTTHYVVIGEDGNLFYSLEGDEPTFVNLLDDDEEEDDEEDDEEEDEEPRHSSRGSRHKDDDDDEEEVVDTTKTDYKDKLDKAVLEEGKNGKNKYTYFGQVKSDGTWNGYGLIFWDHPDFYIGEFKNGSKKGIGLSRNGNGKLCFSTYDNWDVHGPSVEVNKNSSSIALAMNGGKYNNYYFLIEPGETVKKCRINSKGKPEVLYEYEDIVISSKMPDVDFDINLEKISTNKISRTEGKNYVSYDNFYNKSKNNFDLSFFENGEEFIGTRKNGQLDGIAYSKMGKTYTISMNEDSERQGTYFVRYDDGSFGVSFYIKDKHNYITLNKDGVLDIFVNEEQYQLCFANDKINNAEVDDEEEDEDAETPRSRRHDDDDSEEEKDPVAIEKLVRKVDIDVAKVNFEENETSDGKDTYHYFGQYDCKTWHGVGMLYWSHPSVYIGQFRNGHKSGVGLYRFEDGSMRFTYYKDNEGYGSFIDVEGDTVKLYPNSRDNSNMYSIKAGGYLEEYEKNNDKWELIKTYKNIKLPKEFEIGEFSTNLTKCAKHSMERVTAKDKSWDSFQETGVPNGKKFLDCTVFKGKDSKGEFDLSVRCTDKKNNCRYDGITLVYDKDENSIEIKEYIDGELVGEYFKYSYDGFLTVILGSDDESNYMLHLNNDGVFVDKDGDPINSTSSGGSSKDDDDDDENDRGHSSHGGHRDDDDDDDDSPKSTKREHSSGGSNSTGQDPEEELAKLIGLDNVKTQITRIKAYLKKNEGDINLHMCFYGNPGTGKTVVARLIAKILHKINVLPTEKLIETSRDGLIGQYIGETGQKTQKIIDDAMGGVLFIDEAYNLAKKGDDKDFGKEAVATLIKEMEDKRGKFCVILAGYRNEMEEMISVNPGFKSRIQYKIDFPNYNREEMSKIGQLMLAKKKYTMSKRAYEKMLDILVEFSKSKDFANARDVRNIIDQLILIQNVRTEDELENREINEGDVNTYMEERGMSFSDVEDDSFVTVNYRGIRKYSDNFDDSSFKFDQRKLEECAVYLHNDEGDSSGVLISSDGLIATCAHCVSKKCVTKASVIYISHNGKKIIEESDTKIIDIDYDNDVAVIKATDFNNMTEFHPLEKEGAEPIKPLTEIVMAGYPFGGSRLANISINKGLVQSINVDNRSSKRSELVLVDLSGKGGNSGSGVLDAKTGRVVGIFSGSLMQPLGNTDSVEEINFFRPIKFVWKILKHHSD